MAAARKRTGSAASSRALSWEKVVESARGAVVVVVGAALMLSAAVGVGDAEIYKFQRSDGTWVFTDNPAQLPEGAQVYQAPGGGTPAVEGDLQARLYARLRPGTEVEKAMLATVVVVSKLGRGSGFFVSDGGHILTNRHVIRTSDSRKAQVRVRNDRIDARIDQHRKQLAREQARIDAAVAELKSLKGRVYPESYRKREEEYRGWQAALDRKKATFAEEVEKLRDQADEEAYKARLADLDRSFTVVLADQTELRVRLVAVSERLDLALLKLDGHRTPFLVPEAADRLPAGEKVYAIGNPAILHHSVAAGILSGYEGGYIKTDAKIYPGNSGGPLVSERGRALGVNTFKRLTYRFEGLGFAVPIGPALEEFKRHLAGSKSAPP